MKNNILLLVFSLGLLAFPDLLYSKTTFTVTTKENIYAVGYSVDVEFVSAESNLSLSNIDLSVFEQDFVIHDYNVDKYEDFVNGIKISSEKLIVRLFPRRHGTVIIPSFRFGGIKSKKFKIKIINAFNNTIQIRTNPLKKSYFQREAIFIYIDVFQKRKKVSTEVEQLVNKNFIISNTHKSENTVRRNKSKVSVERYSWIVLPLNYGKFTLSLPMVKTGGRKMYPSGNISINVKSLPSTLPTYIPVGTQSIQSSGFNTEKRWVNQLYFWTLKLTGNGISPEAIEKLLSDKLLDNNDVSFYSRSYTVQRNKKGDNFITNITIPFKAHTTGNLNLSAINIPYINPLTGKLEHTESSNETLFMNSPSYENLKVLIIVFILMGILVVPLIKFGRKLRYKWHFKICYKLIKSSDNPVEIRDILFKWSPYKSKSNINSIQDWSLYVNVDLEQIQTKEKIITLLNELCYGSRKDFQQKKSNLKQYIQSMI